MREDKTITLTIIIGLFILSAVSIVIYGANGKDLTTTIITGFFSFLGGGATAILYKDSKKEGEQ